MEANPLDPIRHRINIGDRQGARTALAELLDAQPDHADAWALLAILLTEPAEQAQCYREILRINPNDRQAALWLESLTVQVKARHAEALPAPQGPRGRDCPRCGEIVRASPLPGSPDAAVVCPSCGFPVPLTDAPGDEESGDAADAELEWIPEGLDLEQLLQESSLASAVDESQFPTHDLQTPPRPAERKAFLDRLLGRLRGRTAEDEAEELLMGPIEAVSATGALSPDLILRLAGGPLAPEERRECPTCGAVVSRTDARCPWCSTPLSEAEDP